MNQTEEIPSLFDNESYHPWPHRLAVLVACATFPLIWVGGLVTTCDAGMAVPDWPSTFGYNLFLYPWQIWISGPWDLFIEHGHRLLAALVGFLTLVMSAVVWRFETRVWVRWFSVACIVGVVGQGVLGGMRVLLDERVLAKIHGCSGPLFFCLAVTMVIVTSANWRTGYSIHRPAAVNSSWENVTPLGMVISLAWLVTVIAFVQIVVGAQLRHITVTTSHSYFRIALFFHIALALAIMIHAVLLAIKVLYLRLMSIRRLAVILIGLVAVQVLLGIASWIVNYGPPTWLASWIVGYTVAAKTLTQSLVVTGHVATGSLILVTSLVIALRTSREQWLCRALARVSDRPKHRPSENHVLSLEVVA